MDCARRILAERLLVESSRRADSLVDGAWMEALTASVIREVFGVVFGQLGERIALIAHPAEKGDRGVDGRRNASTGCVSLYDPAE